MGKPLISIVFVNYNGKELLRAALRSLRKSTCKNYEVLVVDNASTDGSREMVTKEFSRARLIRNSTNQGYTGINAALPSCKGAYILFLNNDLELHPASIKRLLKVLENDPTAALAVPRLVNYYDRKIDSAGTWVSRSFYNGHHRADKTGNTIKEIPYMGIGLIRKEAVQKFGYLFDPDYFIYAEDLDLGIRIRLLGMKTLHVPSAIAYHMHSQAMKHIPDARKAFLLERNLLTTFYKDMGISSILLFMPYAYAMRLLAILRDILTLRFAVALARIRAVFAVLFSIPSILQKRKKVQSLREAPDSYILKAFTEKHLFSRRKINI
ncbi:TPA: glycosyltransferase family 2 protein [Candidatus Woesearchaeota archaeon]|nr:glycosyltransferase family 2 protein [Candidatus Woesearchaeota archaeon]